MIWRFVFPCTIISYNKILRIETPAAARIHWTADNWQTTTDTDTKDTKVGMHIADIDFGRKRSGEIKFTFFWKEANHWENKDFEVKIVNE
jgi:glucoamylase